MEEVLSFIALGNDPVNYVDPDGGCIFCETAANSLTLSEIIIKGTAKAASSEFAAWKFIPQTGFGIGLGMGVLDWFGNITRSAYKWSAVGILTTSSPEWEGRGYAMRQSIQNVLDFAALPDYAKNFRYF